MSLREVEGGLLAVSVPFDQPDDQGVMEFRLYRRDGMRGSFVFLGVDVRYDQGS